MILSKVPNLEKRSNAEMYNITKINISNNNPNFKEYKNKMIIDKSSISQNNFDCLVFLFLNYGSNSNSKFY